MIVGDNTNNGKTQRPFLRNKIEFKDWDGNKIGRLTRAQNLAAIVLEDKFLNDFMKPRLQAECAANGITLI